MDRKLLRQCHNNNIWGRLAEHLHRFAISFKDYTAAESDVQCTNE